jgi:DNA polymerase-3 subunit alpha
MSTMTKFVHLRLHTEYSLSDSVIRIPDLVDRLTELGMPAAAVTDQGNVACMVKFYRAACARGIKPLLGADVWLAESALDREPTRLTLLCANRQGFNALSRLLTRSHADGQAQGRAIVFKEWLDTDSLTGLVALSGGQHGELGRCIATGRPAAAEQPLQEWLARMPGRFYIELQRIGRPGEDAYVAAAVELASRSGTPIVATNDVCFLRPEDFEAHEARVCIAQGRTLDDPARPREYATAQYLRSAAEMARLFEDLPEALANTVEIARRCSCELDLGKSFLPDFDGGDEETAAAQLRRAAEAGLELRLTAQHIEPAAQAPYRARLDSELAVIEEMGFEGYFLIVADFIAWANRNAIPVGPGRGSGAGSLVAYSLGITGLDPLEHDLLFERFLNPERVSMPDFDIDFCIEGRDRVIAYVADRYGRDRVSQIVTYGTMAAKAVVRDVGRVLGMPYGYVDRIAKLIPFEIGITLDKALKDDEELKRLYETDEDTRALIDLAQPLEGLARNAGTHAGGVVIAPTPLIEFTPLFRDADGNSLTQLDKDDVEAIGLVKFDFLGLKTLTIIDKALASINRALGAQGRPAIDISRIDMEDRATYELLCRCQTVAVFQLESRGMRDLIKRIQPDRFGDLVAIVALFRPGPMHMADDFISRKQGKESIDYLHPSLEPVLRSTYGVILYQEQVMQIAQVLAGYSLGGADLLRRAMGKKKPEEMAKQRAVFLAGATERGLRAERAAHIFDLMEKFAGYGFNKSHSAAYALVAYQTAWLKTHFPEAYMAAVLTADMDNTDKLIVLKDDCAQMGIRLNPPSVNDSSFEFTVGAEREIVYGLGAIKGVGRASVDAIIGERAARGPFGSLMDLCNRVDPHKLGRRTLEALAKAGALDTLGENRATFMRLIPGALRLAEHAAHAAAAGQGGLFGEPATERNLDVEALRVREWSQLERLAGEREALGLYLTGHPFGQYADHCRHFTHGPLAKLVASMPAEGTGHYQKREVTVAGLVTDMRRRGNRLSVVIDDATDRIELTFFDEVFAQSRHLLVKDAVIVVDGQLRFDDFLGAWRVTALRVRPVEQLIEERARRLTIRWNGQGTGPEFVRRLQETLRPYRQGKCEICIQYARNGHSAMLTLGEPWRVRPTRELREQLGELLGEERLLLQYPRDRQGA